MAKQGQGFGTKRKEDGFSACLGFSLGVSMAPSVRERTYWHIDLNAGCGFNAVANCDGSPVIFCERAIQKHRPFHAFFCDNVAAHIEQLNTRLAGYHGQRQTIQTRVCDNGYYLAEVAGTIIEMEGKPDFAIGTMLCDPNGWVNGFPINQMAWFLERFPRIDLILNLNVNFIRAAIGCKKPGHTHENSFDYVPDNLETGLLPKFHKRHWFVRNPGRHNGHQFMTLFGFNNKRGNRPFKHFWPLLSPEGQRIMRELRYVEIGQRYLYPGLE